MRIHLVERRPYSFHVAEFARVSECSGEIIYTLAISKHGGIWYRSDWVGDGWNHLSEVACRERFPSVELEAAQAAKEEIQLLEYAHRNS